MKIFIQKSINSIFINIFSIRYFVKKNFLSRKISKKAPSKRAISSKIEFSRSSFQVSKEASILETSNSSWEGKKIRKDWKKVSYALGIQLARFPPPISSPRNGYRARQFAKQPRRSISSTRSVATRDPESSTSGLFEGGELLEARAFGALQLPVQRSSNPAPAR